MEPFEKYPGRGEQLLGRVLGANCRKGYGLQFMQKTGQTHCAYCRGDLCGSYEAWLTMALDHVVPAAAAKLLGVKVEWVEDACNRVLTCAACNTFDNRYRLPVNTHVPETFQAFCHLRDAVFAERKGRIEKCHSKEREFFAKRLWDVQPPRPA